MFPQAARKPAERRTTGNLISFFFLFHFIFFLLPSTRVTYAAEIESDLPGENSVER